MIGRTTRMLHEAVREARAGRAVYVMAATTPHKMILKDMLRDITGDDTLGIQIEPFASFTTFDWWTMRFLGHHPNSLVLVDHYAIECHFAGILEMLHRFDDEVDDA